VVGIGDWRLEIGSPWRCGCGFQTALERARVRGTIMLWHGPAEIIRFPQNDGMGSCEPIPQSVTLSLSKGLRVTVGEW
jgi:hypothetical protein